MPKLAYQDKIKNELKSFVNDCDLKKLKKWVSTIKAADEDMADIYLTGARDGKHSLLHEAAMVTGRDQKEIVKIMEYLRGECGLYVDIEDAKGRTPLVFAVDRGNVKVVEYLISEGADASISNYLGNNALHVACEPHDHSKEIVELLLAKGDVKVTDANKKGVTPLHVAARYGNIEAMYAILSSEEGEIKDLLKLKDDDGDTPLHYAALDEGGKAVTFLLGLGAKKTIKNGEGKTPYQVAEEWEPGGKAGKAIFSPIPSTDIDELYEALRDKDTYDYDDDAAGGGGGASHDDYVHKLTGEGAEGE